MNSQPAAEPSPANSDTASVPSLGSPSGLHLNCGYGTDRGLRRCHSVLQSEVERLTGWDLSDPDLRLALALAARLVHSAQE